jgi:drug/metabolite transporter (DMT)-like permease
VALAAAALFGLTTPLVRRFGVSVGPFATAALLYVGSAVGSGAHRRGGKGEPALGAAQQQRVLVAAVLGATLAPASLAWGLQHAGALAASLLLNLEALFTVLLARALYREPLGARFAAALALMLVGGALLAVRAAGGGASTFLGLAAVLGASLGWAIDSTISRPLADFDARTVVFAKSVAGVALSVALAFVAHDAWPPRDAAWALVACGVVGYGLSLRFYLRAQRALGAARTATLFALAPFIGAAAAFAAGDREGAGLVGAAGAVFAVAAYLQTTEDHRHSHRHETMEHEHLHRHDDGHHSHTHEPPVTGEHSHIHRHEETEHEHSHASDIHHGHGHDRH